MDLGFISILVSIGVLLGSGVLNFVAYNRSKTNDVNRAVIDDQETRIKQLEEERKRDKQTITDQETRIKQLENEKALPLETLTKLIISNNKQQTALLNTIVSLLKEREAK